MQNCPWEDANGGAPGSTTRRIIKEAELKKRPLIIWEDFDPHSDSRSHKSGKRRRNCNTAHSTALSWEDAKGKRLKIQNASIPKLQSQHKSNQRGRDTPVVLARPRPLPQSPSDVVQIGRRPPPPPPPLQPQQEADYQDDTDDDCPGCISVASSSEDSYSSSEDSSSSDSECDDCDPMKEKKGKSECESRSSYRKAWRDKLPDLEPIVWSSDSEAEGNAEDGDDESSSSDEDDKKYDDDHNN